MLKSDLVKALIESIKNDLSNIIKATQAAHRAATDDENIPENKYDTQSLEASYIAQGQANRAQELRSILVNFESISLLSFNNSTPIQLSALVTLENEEGEKKHLFLAAVGGGIKIKYNNKHIIVVTPSSPLGSALMGKEEGDTIEIQTNTSNNAYEILRVE